MGRSPGGTALCSPQFIRGRLGGNGKGINGGVLCILCIKGGWFVSMG
jgi:hypothetical protein